MKDVMSDESGEFMETCDKDMIKGASALLVNEREGGVPKEEEYVEVVTPLMESDIHEEEC